MADTIRYSALEDRLAEDFEPIAKQITQLIAEAALNHLRRVHPELLQQGKLTMVLALSAVSAEFGQLIALGAQDTALKAVGSVLGLQDLLYELARKR